MCDECHQPSSSVVPLGPDEKAACEECSAAATRAHLTRSVCFHLCEEHAKMQQDAWTTSEETYYQGAGLHLATEFVAIGAGESCGYHLPASPNRPPLICGKPATHVEVDSDRHFYCDEHRLA